MLVRVQPWALQYNYERRKIIINERYQKLREKEPLTYEEGLEYMELNLECLSRNMRALNERELNKINEKKKNEELQEKILEKLPHLISLLEKYLSKIHKNEIQKKLFRSHKPGDFLIGTIDFKKGLAPSNEKD